MLARSAACPNKSHKNITKAFRDLESISAQRRSFDPSCIWRSACETRTPLCQRPECHASRARHVSDTSAWAPGATGVARSSTK